MRFGLIGYGSIGRRHVQNLLKLGQEDIILLRARGTGNEHRLTEYDSLDAFLAAGPDAVVLANPTSIHYEYLSSLIPHDMNLLVEKPLVSDSGDLEKLRGLLQEYKGYGMAAFNMRFHPVVIKTREWLKSGRIGQTYSARFHVGQYLPDWRPEQDYRQSYSAISQLGGGVMLDLIHEIDLATHLIGLPADAVSSRIIRSSDLEIDSEALAEILYTDSNGTVVSIHLDYLTYGYRRHFEIVGSKASLSADLSENLIKLTDRSGYVEEVGFQRFDRNDMYYEMMKSFIEGLEYLTTNTLPLHEVLNVNEIALTLRDGVAYGD